MSSVQAAADAAAALAARREEIARRWADLPLFTTVFAGQREDAHGAASRLVDASWSGRSGSRPWPCFWGRATT
jgi:rsbT co-antagonist protein RsbR